MSFEITFFDYHNRGGKCINLKCSLGDNIFEKAYECLQKDIFESSALDEYKGDKTKPVDIIQFIIDSNVYSTSFIQDLVKNHHIFSLKNLMDKVTPINLLQLSWKIKSVVYVSTK